jgi:MtN3 and saliva related transmembrane protein
MSTAELLGYVAAVFTTLSFVPQVLRVYRTRSAHDISATMYGMFIFGLALWIGYGVLLRAWPIVVANTITVLLAAAILGMKLRFDARA